MCNTCKVLAASPLPMPSFTADGVEVFVRDRVNRAILINALTLYADEYLDRCETLGHLATDPADSDTHLRNAINTTDRICAMLTTMTSEKE